MHMNFRRAFAVNRLRIRPLLALLGLAGLIGAVHLLSPGSAQASNRQVSIIEEENVFSSPAEAATVLQELRHLGVTETRVEVQWASIAPSPTAATKPAFNSADPGAYPAANWSQLDSIVRTASADGVKVLMTVTGAAPAWAQGKGKPGGSTGASLGAWKPSASEYGNFVKALGIRYSGHYRGLPRVSTWEIYSEPNFGEHLSPQNAGGVTAAGMYRALLAAAWNGLHASGHGHDTVVFGATSAHGEARLVGGLGIAGETQPLTFLRELYCVDARYHQLRGGAAKPFACPTNPRAARSFRRQNPALFFATAFSDHPYPLGNDESLPPTQTRYHGPNYATFSQLPNLINALNRSVKAWGSGKKFAIWNTEYGYISNPPRGGGVTLANQAYYLNWAEYLSWKNPQIGSFMNFLLVDPDPTVGVVACGGFASGLIFNPALTTAPCAGGQVGNTPKPALAAWRLPLYMPTTSGRKGKPLEVWGCVRPGPFAFRDTHRTQLGQIQFSSNGATWSTVATVRANGNCYFDQKVKFPSSGQVRLAYTYPAGDTRLAPTYGAGTYFNPLTPSVSRYISIKLR